MTHQEMGVCFLFIFSVAHDLVHDIAMFYQVALEEEVQLPEVKADTRCWLGRPRTTGRCTCRASMEATGAWGAVLR